MTDAKRRLTDIKFEHAGAHVALVGTHQGGPANGVTTLVYKSLNIPEELIEKAGQVVVTLEFEDFLRKFFGMYWEDAEVLPSCRNRNRNLGSWAFSNGSCGCLVSRWIWQPGLR